MSPITAGTIQKLTSSILLDINKLWLITCYDVYSNYRTENNSNLERASAIKILNINNLLITMRFLASLVFFDLAVKTSPTLQLIIKTMKNYRGFALADMA